MVLLLCNGQKQNHTPDNARRDKNAAKKLGSQNLLPEEDHLKSPSKVRLFYTARNKTPTHDKNKHGLLHAVAREQAASYIPRRTRPLRTSKKYTTTLTYLPQRLLLTGSNVFFLFFFPLKKHPSTRYIQHNNTTKIRGEKLASECLLPEQRLVPQEHPSDTTQNKTTTQRLHPVQHKDNMRQQHLPQAVAAAASCPSKYLRP